MLRSPHGGVEDVAEMANAGMRWLGLNIGDYDAYDWRIVRERAQGVGVETFPKARLGLPTDTRAAVVAKLELICQTAVAWRTTKAIVNAEKELDFGLITPSEIAVGLAAYGLTEAGTSTEAWLYAAPDWGPLTRWPLLLQIYPEDNGWTPEQISDAQARCVRRARAYGFKHVGVTFQTWRADPQWYDRRGHAWNLAFGDDVGYGNWWKWA